ncbi:S8 family serine peptidase [Dactylosporangium matsuzakiense]|uniref:Peptidase S8/S53 domain-containing protein n=1 Tax=Dactylosporangium matsuzakiense TaxID=53360 RepID=A0A9W6NTV0_9ACTN|nr:S8 family serine peptidase [Dactylosporangium matsuzakiense]UWZ41167.1 S8 family serine peptidase [Dactylosporangium matsuzakiense]GLL08786.1 hypothetical protein GCM10017581_105600 [Dactylosporangium matsuzakiense]
MTRLTVRRTIAATLAVLAGLTGPVLWAGPAQADPVRQYQWYLTPLKFTEVHQITKGAGVVVGVVDTPIFEGHRDLKGQLLQGTSTGGGPANGWGADNPGNAHGTEVASLIVGKGGGDDHLLGIAPAAKILPVAYSNGGNGTSISTASGIKWAADHGAKVINLSNGHNGSATDEETEAIRYAIAKDVVVVAGAGNRGEGMDAVISPANIPGVVAVSGVEQGGNFWSGSTYGPETVVAAPGSQMSVAGDSTTFPSGYGLADGTSLSTAIVSGVVALIRSKFPQMNAANVINRLIRTARDNGNPGRDPKFGFGTIQPLAALTADVPAVDANPLGGPAAGQPGPSSTAGKPSPPALDGHLHVGRLVALIACPVVALGALLAVIIVAARRRNRRPVPPPATAQWPGPPGGVPPPQYQPPPPTGSFRPPPNWPPSDDPGRRQ